MTLCPSFCLLYCWRKFSKINFSDALRWLYSPPLYLHLGCSRMVLLKGFYPLVGCEREEKYRERSIKCWLTSQGERTSRTRKLILCDVSSDAYNSTETPACIYVRTFLTASEKDVCISCTPRAQICKSCTPNAAGLISCARQNWSLHANHAKKFSVHAEVLPENVHTFQTGFGNTVHCPFFVDRLFMKLAIFISWHLL